MRWVTCLVAVAGVAWIGIVAVTLLIWGYPAETGGDVHARWVHHFGKQLWEGDPYPRWLIGPNSGFGSAAFWYYPPLPFWVSSLFYPIAPTPWHALGWSAATALLVSGVTSFAFFRQLVSVKAAALGSFCYVIAPYPMAHVLFVHGAYAQFWAFAWMPLVLLGIDRSARSSNPGIAILTLALSLLFLTHVLTAIVFAPLAAAYALMGGWRRVWSLCLAFVWAMGLTAIYWMPILWVRDKIAGAEQPYFQGELLESTFFFQGWSTLEAMSPFAEGFDNALLLGIFLVTLLILYLGCWWGLVESKWFGWLGWTLIGLGGFYLVMQTPLSRPVFELLPPLQRIQFASRLMSPVTLITVLVLVLLAHGWHRQSFHARVISAVAIAVWLGGAMAVTGWKSVEGYGMTTRPLARVGPPKTDYSGRDARGEYTPRMADIHEAREFFDGDDSPCQAKWVDGEGGFQVKEVGNGFHIQIRADRPGTLVFHQFHFPGWRAKERGSDHRLKVHRHPGTGLMQIEVPPGTPGIDLRYGTVTNERIGAGISLVSLIALAAPWVRRRRDSGPKRRARNVDGDKERKGARGGQGKRFQRTGGGKIGFRQKSCYFVWMLTCLTYYKAKPKKIRS